MGYPFWVHYDSEEKKILAESTGDSSRALDELKEFAFPENRPMYVSKSYTKP